MDWRIWIGFVTASALIGLVPGPGVMSIVGYALSSGRRVALASVAGIALGNGIAMTLSLAGVGALLSASALAFTIVKWIGATYLIGLGILAIVRSRSLDDGQVSKTPPVRPRVAFASNVAVGTFHPKTIVFFVAFVPQFIDPAARYAPQAALLIATFCAVVACTDTFYALAASRASQLLRPSERDALDEAGRRRRADRLRHRDSCGAALIQNQRTEADASSKKRFAGRGSPR